MVHKMQRCFCCGKRARTEFIIAQGKYYYSGRENKLQKTDNEYIEDLKKFLGDTKIKAIIVDPSAASFIASLRQNNYNVIKAKNDVLNGIRYTGNALNEGKIKINVACENTIKEFASYVWDEKASLQGEDKPVKDFDHAMDAMRYFVSTVLAPTRTVKIGNKANFPGL